MTTTTFIAFFATRDPARAQRLADRLREGGWSVDVDVEADEVNICASRRHSFEARLIIDDEMKALADEIGLEYTGNEIELPADWRLDRGP